MIVLKFGGTSVGNAERVQEVASIIERQPTPRAAVVSAASGVTNLLLTAAEAAAAGDQEQLAESVAKIHDIHNGVLGGIGAPTERALATADVILLHAALDAALGDVASAGELSKRDSDRIVSTGEKSMSVMMAATLRARGTAAVHLFDQVSGQRLN